MDATEKTRLRALYDAATPGPWPLREAFVRTAIDSGDLGLIVGAVNALPAMLNALDAAERNTAREDLARIGRLVGCDSLVGVEIHAAVEHVVRHELEAARDAAERAERERDALRAKAGDDHPWGQWAQAFQRERDESRRQRDAAERERDDARAEVETMRAEAALMREIIEGRTTPPTDEELIAHDARGALWMVVRGSNVAETCVMVWASSRDFYVQRGALRWWPLDADGRPCAWPTVTP